MRKVFTTVGDVVAVFSHAGEGDVPVKHVSRPIGLDSPGREFAGKVSKRSVGNSEDDFDLARLPFCEGCFKVIEFIRDQLVEFNDVSVFVLAGEILVNDSKVLILIRKAERRG